MSLRVTIRGNRYLSETGRRKIERKRLRVQDELENILRDIHRSWQRRINWVSGTLGRSGVVFGFTPTRGRARLEITAPHAAPVEKGARPHEITASPGKVLRWVGRDGEVHYAKRVQHPGNPPGHQLRDAVRDNRRVLRPRIQTVLRARD